MAEAVGEEDVFVFLFGIIYQLHSCISGISRKITLRDEISLRVIFSRIPFVAGI
jgi:hypothetical protein